MKMRRPWAWLGGAALLLVAAVGLTLRVWPEPGPLDFSFRLGDADRDGRLSEVEFLSVTLLSLGRPALPGEPWLRDPLPWMVRLGIPLPEAQRQRVAALLRQGAAPAKHQTLVFRRADANHDGWVVHEELDAYARQEAVRDRQIVLNRQGRGRLGPSERWVASALLGFDQDHDGRLSLLEFQASLQGAPQVASAPAVFTRFDRNGDRHLDAAELGAMVGSRGADGA